VAYINLKVTNASRPQEVENNTGEGREEMLLT